MLNIKARLYYFLSHFISQILSLCPCFICHIWAVNRLVYKFYDSFLLPGIQCVWGRQVCHWGPLRPPRLIVLSQKTKSCRGSQRLWKQQSFLKYIREKVLIKYSKCRRLSWWLSVLRFPCLAFTFWFIITWQDISKVSKTAVNSHTVLHDATIMFPHWIWQRPCNIIVKYRKKTYPLTIMF